MNKDFINTHSGAPPGRVKAKSYFKRLKSENAATAGAGVTT